MESDGFREIFNHHFEIDVVHNAELFELFDLVPLYVHLAGQW